jgi:hypothetical protein
MATPHLSNDYFRFTWDGEIHLAGKGAFEFLPSQYKTEFEQDSLQIAHFQELYVASSDEFPSGMNSKNYYSIYPAVNQMVFVSSSWFGSPNSGNLVVMRFWLLLAEVISFFILLSLLKNSYKHVYVAALYWLNPLLIVEVVGNLHFDGLAITFILLALWFIQQKKYTWTGVAVAMAVHTKLNPLFILGALFRKVSLKYFIWLTGVSLALIFMMFLMIMDTQGFLNFKKSFGLYFAWFGFNAGPYYLIRSIGEVLFGRDISSWISLFFPFISMGLMAYITLFSKKEIAHKLLILYVIYFSFTPILHPWYIVVLVPLGILSGKIYPIVWSFVVFFTYSAFGEPYRELEWIVYAEFALVYTIMFLEYKKNPFLQKLKNSMGLRRSTDQV